MSVCVCDKVTCNKVVRDNVVCVCDSVCGNVVGECG